MSSTPPPLPPSGPPPLPGVPRAGLPPSAVFSPHPVRLEGRPVPGAEDLAYCDLEPLVAEGGKFVAYTYCFSVLIMTFKRHSGIHFVRPGQSGARAAWAWSALTMMAGWWGFPWGPVYSISSLYQNCRGGMDVTEAVMATFSGQQRAAQLMARRQKVPVGAGIWALRVAVLALPAFLIWLLVTATPSSDRTLPPKPSPSPLQSTYDVAVRGLKRYDSAGNTPEARELAGLYQAECRKVLDARSPAAPDGAGASAWHFWCEMQPGQCAFLVQPPAGASLDGEDGKKLGAELWRAAVDALEHAPTSHPKLKLAVATRRGTSVDRIFAGDYEAGRVGGPPPAEMTGLTAEVMLISFFLPPEKTPSPPATFRPRQTP